MEKLTTHQGVVTAVSHRHVQVKMEVLSACATCESHSHCGFAEKKDKLVEVDTDRWRDYHVGDHVVVAIGTNRGMQAVLLAYVLPSVVLLAVFAVLCLLHVPEGLTALLTLLSAALYALLLYLIRPRLQKKFTFRLSHQD